MKILQLLVDGHLYPTYRSACASLGLLEDDREWVSCFQEASQFSSGKILRTLIISILTHGSIANPGALCEQFSQNICDDLACQLDLFQEIPADFPDPHIDYGLFLIQRDLERRGRSCADFGMPSPILNWEVHRVNYLISDERISL